MQTQITRDELRHFIKKGLKRLVEDDARIQLGRLNSGRITEYTLQAIIWDHLSRFVHQSWMLSIEDFIPGLNKKADIVLCKLAHSGEIDERFGAIAIEVKPNGQLKGLKKAS